MEDLTSFDTLAPRGVWPSFQSLELGVTDEEMLGLFTRIDFDIGKPSHELANPFAKGLEEHLDLPQLEPLEGSEVGLSGVPHSNESMYSSEQELDLDRIGGDELDIWADFTAELNPYVLEPVYSWESFANPSHEELASAHLSDAGIEAFEAALALRAQYSDAPQPAGLAVSKDSAIKPVLALAAGRPSTFFDWHARSHRFREVLDDTRIVGHSLESSQRVFSRAARCGAQIKQLRVFTTHTYRSSSALPSRVALARASEVVMSAMEAHLDLEASRARTFAQLHAVLERPAELLQTLEDFVAAVKGSRSDFETTSRSFEYSHRLDIVPDTLSKIIKCVLNDVARPLLRQINIMSGLSNDIQDTSLERPETMDLGSLLTSDVTGILEELAKGLHLLRTHQPLHPLCQASCHGASPPQLELTFKWRDIDRIRLQAEAYEKDLSVAILSYCSSEIHVRTDALGLREDQFTGSSYDWDAFVREVECEESTQASFPQSPEKEPLEDVTFAYLQGRNDGEQVDLEPELPLCPTLCFSPILSAQSRLVNSASLRLIFRSTRLRPHLALQHQYHLLGSGDFVARLASALFDPARATTERQKGVMRTNESLGLRLGSRQTWPPASSELQLALMGLITDCYHRSSLPTMFEEGECPGSVAMKDNMLPGDLSFAIRQLPADEAERCMDANSLYALDFLRLRYVPPAPVDAIIVPESLEKYDTIFKALLRLQRIIFVISNLACRSRAGQRPLAFELEARHFVTCCAAFFIDSGVKVAWFQFCSFLDAIESRMEAEDKAGKLSQSIEQGMAAVRTAHNQYLDRIMNSLLLRKRHAEVRELMEEVFGLILSYAQTPEQNKATDTRSSLTNKILLFIGACRELMGKHEQGDSGGIERLLLALDMNRYYSHRTMGRNQ